MSSKLHCHRATCLPFAGGVIAVRPIIFIIVSGHELDRVRKTSGNGLLLYAIPGSVWPSNSLLNMLCHRNKTHHSCPMGYHGKPKSLAS